MERYVCGPCGYVYDPEVGDPDNGVERHSLCRHSRRLGYALLRCTERHV